MPLHCVLETVDRNLTQSLERLFEVLRIASISTDTAYHAHCLEAAQWAASQLAALGFDAEVKETAGKPMVLAKRHPAGAKRKVLFYGHYDVQPPEPLALWEKPPFEPYLKEGTHGQQIVARGSSDDKGQFMTFIEAVRAWIETEGELPVAVTILLEGEEETGSPSLKPFLDAHKQELQADVALVSDTSQWSHNHPAITTRLRGLLIDELTITTLSRDLHSGMFGGPARNPIHLLSKILGNLHDADGRVQVPGFYDGIAPLSDNVTAQWRTLDFNASSYLGDMGQKTAAGEKDFPILEQIWARPTCDVNGIWGGYTGEGSKTVIPAQASAKVSFRLVPGQDPLILRAAFRAFVESQLPPDASVAYKAFGASAALELPLSSPYLAAARKALHEEWQVDPVLMGCGGSIPIVGSFQRELGMDTLLIGFALDDDRIHSPNEKYELHSFHKGTRSWVRILQALAEM